MSMLMNYEGVKSSLLRVEENSQLQTLYATTIRFEEKREMQNDSQHV